MRLRWDALLHRQLETLRLVFMPVVNPGGLWRGTRANPNGVDLMRNAPVDATERVPFLVGGQRLSAGLPWYRGADGAPMQAESAALCRVVERGTADRAAVQHRGRLPLRLRAARPAVVSVRAHAAGRSTHLPEMHALCELFEQAHAAPSLRARAAEPPVPGARRPVGPPLPARLRAAPAALLPAADAGDGLLAVGQEEPAPAASRATGMFNPLIAHRQQRVLRRHLPWLDFVARAAASHERWLPRGDERERRRGAGAGALVRGRAGMSAVQAAAGRAGEAGAAAGARRHCRRRPCRVVPGAGARPLARATPPGGGRPVSAAPHGGSQLESLGVRSRAPDDGRSTRAAACRPPAPGSCCAA